jgi:hypothetical protein
MLENSPSGMAKLLVKGATGPHQVIELKLGLNHLGRSEINDFQIEHATISARHCDICLSDTGVTVRDCDSTNGTFINGEPVREATLQQGQTLQLGDVELYVESTDVRIAIPKFEQAPDITPPPIVLEDGALLCPNHPKKLVTHQCLKCRQVMCTDCIRRVRRRGGKILLLCPACGDKVEVLGGEPAANESLFHRLAKTIKMRFLREKKQPNSMPK